MIAKQNLQDIEINGTEVKALIDTGSQVSFVSNSLYGDYFGYLPMIPIDRLANYDIEVPVVRTVTGDEVKYIRAVEMQVSCSDIMCLYIFYN